MAGKYQIRTSRRAEADKHHILRYIRSVSSLQTTTGVFVKLEAGRDWIVAYPYSRPIYLSYNGIDYRSYQTKSKHRLLYTVLEEDRIVILVMIVHVSMNRPTILERLQEE